jgi:non-ribosomal peptide synthetase component E (peptide arylation enzyme)
MVALSTAQWTADGSRPILDLSVGDLLGAAASSAPDAIALVAGAADPAQRRRLTYGDLLAQSEQAARALLARFAVGERVAVWANNIPEWVVLELAAGLAGVTIVTVNPALRGEELAHVLGQSRADGIFLVPEYRGTDMARMLDALRGDLPLLREVISFADWDTFCASGSPAERLPDVDPGTPRRSSTRRARPGVPRARCSTTVGSSTTRACARTAWLSRPATCSSARCRCFTPPAAW